MKCMAEKPIHHSMAATRFTIIITVSLLVSISPTSSSSFAAVVRHRSPSQPPPSHQIRQACKATRYQQLCESSLITRSPTTKPLEIVQFALSICSKNLRVLQSKIHSILQSSVGNLNLTTAVKICTEHLRHAEYRLNLTAVALRRRRIKDGRAWTSSALSYQSVCWNELKKVNNTDLNHLMIINETMSFIDTLIGYISNTLSMMMAYDVFGDKLASWRPPETERERFWEVGTAEGGGGWRKLGIPVGLKVNVTVCKGGGCRYSRVQEAVDAAADWGGGGGRWFVIWVKAGVYKETVRVGLEKQNLVILGEGMGKTVITGALNVGQIGISTYGSATVGVVGDGFMARGLTIENMAGPVTHQAVAFRSESDQSIIEDCEFLSNQDTLYLPSHRQLFKSCRIQGNVDFIFGNSASIFQDCTILIRPRQQNPEKGETNTITAHSRTDPAQSTGFVFQNCLVNGTEEYMRLYQSNPKVHKNYLGRPWKEFSRTVFIGCKMEALITAEGWTEWTGDFGLKTLYYGEFGNSGKGSDLSRRVAWSSRIPANHVNVYSIRNFIQGNQWKLAS